jgi:hypothetical protein
MSHRKDVKRSEKREKLIAKDEEIKAQFSARQAANLNALSIKVEGFPKTYNQLMLKELVQSYPGLQDYKLESQTGYVRFLSHEDAEVALAGKLDTLDVFH